MHHVVPIAASEDPDTLAALGGKGRGLALLAQAGARVPRGVAIPPEAPVRQAVAEALAWFGDREGRGLYAVRSSASVEDGRERSYAGQFESFLRVSGVGALESAVEASRRSGESARVVAYAGSPARPALSVVIQEMVEPDCAGILFTCDPVTGSRSHLVVEAVPGTAEDLAGGSRAGHLWVLDQGGAILEGTSDLLRPGVLASLAEEALALEERLAVLACPGPLDFEWALQGGNLAWLQVRPVTAWRRADPRESVVLIGPEEAVHAGPGETHWTSVNAREAVPGVLTALMEDLVVGLVDAGFAETFRLFGIEADSEHRDTVGVRQGRPFLNLTVLEAMVGRLPIQNPEAVVGSILGQTTEPARPRWSPSLLGVMARIAWRQLRLPAEVRSFEAREARRWRYPSAAHLRRLDAPALWGVVTEALDFLEPFALHVQGGMRYMAFYPPLRELSRAHGADAGTLLQGLGTLRFASAAGALRDLARALQPLRGQLFDARGTPVDDWAERLDDPGARAARRALDDFLEEYGHLGTGSLDLVHPTWRGQPWRVLQMVGSLLRQGDDQGREAWLARLRASRDAAARQAMAGMGLLERLRFLLLLHAARHAAPYRENLKFMLQRRMAIAREYLLELGRRFLDDPEDVLHLHMQEIGALVESRGPADLPALLETRKAEYRRCSRLPCPLHRVESPAGARVYYPAPLEAGNTFRGVGAGAGTAVGRARILRSLEEASRLQPGDILVTATTDPCWTPLFSVAGAVVVEVGSLLSHGAVVAREAGIPAVLGIPGIVAALRDGDLLVVDGEAGTVTRQEEVGG